MLEREISLFPRANDYVPKKGGVIFWLERYNTYLCSLIRFETSSLNNTNDKKNLNDYENKQSINTNHHDPVHGICMGSGTEQLGYVLPEC